MKFSEIIGQEATKALLLDQHRQQRIPHAQMLCGPEGVGKFALALAYASYLLCEDPTPEGEPCGHCNGCHMTKALAHPDLHFVFPAYKGKGWPAERKAISADYLTQWREMVAASPYFDLTTWRSASGVESQRFQIGNGEADDIVQQLSLVSAQGGYKVVLVWLPEMMSEDCANKILKVLEEPPRQTIFLMVCNKPEMLLPTISSRLQRIDVPRLKTEEIRDALLSQQHGLSADDADFIANSADGSYLAALQQIKVSADTAEYFDMFTLLMRKCWMRDIKEMYAWADNIAKWPRQKQRDFLAYCQRLIRENFVYNFGLPALNHMSQKEAAFSRNFARFVNERNVIALTTLFDEAQRDIAQNVNSRMVYTDLAINIIVQLRA